MPTVCVQPPVSDFAPAQALAAFMVQELQDPAVTAQQGARRMLAWLQDKPAAAHAALCLLYGLSWYQVQDSCFADQAPLEQQSWWFLACGPEEDAARLPEPAADLVLLWEQTVQALQLKTRFFAEPTAA